ncbi:MAG TPA: RidA family protein, partial [Verrucomicrobiae bacterium]
MRVPNGDKVEVENPGSRLNKLGIVLPAPPVPLGAYVEACESGNLLFLSGCLPVVNGRLAVSGRLG